MKTIYIGFSRPQNLKLPIYAWAIMWLYGTPYSHVYARFVRESGTQFVYESVGSGTRFVSIPNWNKHAVVYQEFPIEVTVEQYDRIIDICINSLGMGYAVKQAIGIGLAKIAKKFGYIMDNPFKDSEAEICSEAIGRVLGMDENLLDEVSPQDIYNYLKGE